MPAEAILALRWIDRASRCVDLTEKAVGGVAKAEGIVEFDPSAWAATGLGRICWT